MSKTFLITLILILTSNLAGCSEIKVKKLNQNKPNKTHDINTCLCPMIWMPVCGKDNKTYSNGCSAKCAGVDFEMGDCSKSITK
jgi:hypothetical protein